MAATGNEIVILSQLKEYGDTKLNAPLAAGTNGQMLVYRPSGNQWADMPEASSTTLGGVKVATYKNAKAFLGF